MKKLNKVLSTILAVLMITSCISVSAFAANLKINKSAITLGVGENYTLVANKSANFSTNNSKVVTIDKAGKMVAKRSGNAVVTAKYGREVKTYKVKVGAAPKSVSINAASNFYIGVGEYFDFNSSLNKGAAAYHRSYTTSDSNILSFKNTAGLAFAKAKGDVKVTVTAYNGVKKSITVKVRVAPTSITFEKSNISLEVGQSFKFVSHVNYGAVARIRTYTSANSKIMKMSGASGKALKTGKTTVTVKTYNGIKAVATVTVTPKTNCMTRAQKNIVLKMFKTDADKVLGKNSGVKVVEMFRTDERNTALTDAAGNTVADTDQTDCYGAIARSEFYGNLEQRSLKKLDDTTRYAFKAVTNGGGATTCSREFRKGCTVYVWFDDGIVCTGIQVSVYHPMYHIWL